MGITAGVEELPLGRQGRLIVSTEDNLLQKTKIAVGYKIRSGKILFQVLQDDVWAIQVMAS